MTPGQKAYEAFRASIIARHGLAAPWEEMPWRADFEAAAAAILEEAAQIADEHARHEHASSPEFAEGYRQAAESIAATLRAKVK